MSGLVGEVNENIQVKNSQEKYDVKLDIREWKCYPEYKDSGVEWLGKIPESWAFSKLKNLTSKIGSGKTPRGGSEIYCGSGIIFLRSQNVHFDGLRLDDVVYIDEIIDSEMTSTRVLPDDVLLNITGASIGRSSIVPKDFPQANVNQHVCIIRPLKNQINSRFLHYELSSDCVQALIFSNENGTSREGLTFSQISNFMIAIPNNLDEQRLISNFLDQETSKIDTLIEKKQRLIGLLEEKRSALISHAVTKGLDPDVKIKNSGIEWIGKIPEQWKIVSVRNMIRSQDLEIQDGNHGELHPKTEEYVDEGIPFIMANDIKNRSIDFHNCKKIPKKLATSLRIGFSKPDDVLLTHKGTVGEVAIVPKNIKWPFIMLTPQVTYYRVRTNSLLKEFLFLFLQSKSIRHQLNLIGSHQSTRNYVGIQAQGDLSLVIPPVEEQSIIYQSLSKETEKIDTFINKISAQIEKLKEYRTALISAAVTGKIDVREEVA